MGAELLGWLPGQRNAAVQEVLFAHLIIACVALLPVAALQIAHSDPEGQRVADRAAYKGGDIDGAEATDGGVDARLEGVGRLGGDIVDRAARGVLTEQRALRSLQHLNPVQVEAGAQGHDRIGQRRFVQIDADRRAGGERGVVEADAADRIDRRAIERGGVVKARHDFDQLAGVRHAEVLQRVATGGGDRHRNVVDALFPLLGGDHQFLDGADRRGLSLGGASHHQDRRRRDSAERERLPFHAYLPSPQRLDAPYVCDRAQN